MNAIDAIRLTQRDVARNYPALQPALHALGNPSEQTLVIGGMLALLTQSTQ